VTAARHKTEKTDATKKTAQIKAQIKKFEAEKNDVQTRLTVLSRAMPRSFQEQNQVFAQQTSLNALLDRAEAALEEGQAQLDSAAAHVAWCEDMLLLHEELVTRAKLGLRVYREVGEEEIEIVAPEAP
jgi:chromosome segregation ATPase